MQPRSFEFNVIIAVPKQITAKMILNNYYPLFYSALLETFKINANKRENKSGPHKSPYNNILQFLNYFPFYYGYFYIDKTTLIFPPILKRSFFYYTIIYDSLNDRLIKL